MDFSLSTSWNAFRHASGNTLIFEIKELGFEEVELSFNLTPFMVDEIEKLVSSGQIKVSSVHNYCPIPENVKRDLALPDYYSVSSTKEEERQMAVKQTRKTIETASRLRAKAVVLHAGRVEIPDSTRKLIDLYTSGSKDSAEFKSIKEEAVRQRQNTAKPFFESALKSLGELSPFASKYDLRLGIENRFYYREIPSFSEIGIILQEFKGSNIYYWHDTGHAEIMDRLGFFSHKALLESYGKDLAGVHLHDVLVCEDHLAPSNGELEFGIVKPYLKEETIKVIEAHYPSSGDDLIKAREFLRKAF